MSNAAAIGLALIVLGTWIRLMTFRHLGRFFRFEVSIQKDHELIVSGPYSIVRHPSYTSFILIFGGWFFWNLSKGSWIMESGLWNTMLGRLLVVIYFSICIILTSFMLLSRMSKEDVALRNKFGKSGTIGQREFHTPSFQVFIKDKICVLICISPARTQRVMTSDEL